MSTFGTKKNISQTKQFVNAGDKGGRGGIVYYPPPHSCTPLVGAIFRNFQLGEN